MEIQNEPKKIAVSEEQVKKMIEVYNKNDKVSAKQETNINAVEQIVMDPVIQTPSIEAGSTNIFDEPATPTIEAPNPIAEPTINIFDEPNSEITPNIPVNVETQVAPETNVFNVEPAEVQEPTPVVEPTQPVTEQQTVEPTNEQQNTKDKEILDKLYDLQLHITQFAIEFEEYLSNKNNTKEIQPILNNTKEIQPINIEPQPTPNYDENTNIFDTPTFKL